MKKIFKILSFILTINIFVNTVTSAGVLSYATSTTASYTPEFLKNTITNYFAPCFYNPKNWLNLTADTKCRLMTRSLNLAGTSKKKIIFNKLVNKETANAVAIGAFKLIQQHPTLTMRAALALILIHLCHKQIRSVSCKIKNHLTKEHGYFFAGMTSLSLMYILYNRFGLL